MRTARAWGRSLAILSALTLLLTGCLKLDMALTVSSDDTVDGELVFAVNKELLELSGQTVDDFLGQTQVPSDVEGATQEPYEDDTFVGTKVIFDSVPLAELQRSSDPDSLSIVREGDRFEVTGVLDLSTTDRELQGNPLEGQITEAFDTAELRIAVTFPGEIIETNGQVDGTTVTWEPKFGERTELTAVASASGDGAEAAADGDSGGTGASADPSGEGSGDSPLIFLPIGLVLIAGLFVLYLVMRRRRGSSAGAPTMPPGAGLPGDASPPAPPAGASTASIPPAPVPTSAPPAEQIPVEDTSPSAEATEPLDGDPGSQPPRDPSDDPSDGTAS